MTRIPKSLASKLISAFATSALFSIYIDAVFPDSGGHYGSLLIPAFFIAYAFVSFFVFPVSLLVDKLTKSVRHSAVAAIVGVLLSGTALALAIGTALLLGARAGVTLALYGMVLMYGYLAIDVWVSRVENKYRKNNLA